MRTVKTVVLVWFHARGTWRVVIGLACLWCMLAMVNVARAQFLLPTADGLVTVRHWGYQLQGPPPEGVLDSYTIAQGKHDLVVMDFSAHGDEASRFTREQIDAVNYRGKSHDSDQANHARRVSVAYVSIGEASEFRRAWNRAWTHNGRADGRLTASAPTWLGSVNPNWPESRKVRYWDARWQHVIFNDDHTGWLDQVVSQGFDAAYLDIVDAYYFWGEEIDADLKTTGDPTDAQDAARRMIDFVVAMVAHARKTNPTFFAIPQNGEFILDDADDAKRAAAYRDAIGAIAVEDVFLPGDREINNPFEPDHERIAVLQRDFLDQGIAVLAVDYANDLVLVQRFKQAALDAGFMPYAAPSRALDRMSEPISEP